MFSQENKVIVIKRLKSLAWRMSVMAAVIVLSFIGENVGLTELSPHSQMIIGLIVAEITKYLNTKTV